MIMQSEIGTFGYILSKDDEILQSGQGSWLVRSKDYRVDEGGLCSNSAVLDHMAGVACYESSV